MSVVNNVSWFFGSLLPDGSGVSGRRCVCISHPSPWAGEGAKALGALPPPSIAHERAPHILSRTPSLMVPLSLILHHYLRNVQHSHVLI